jgi:SAM-dependent methyltransferase
MNVLPLLYRFFPQEPCSVEGYYEEIARRLPARGRLLDLGCGANADLARFRTPERQVWGVDFMAHPQLQYPEWFRYLTPEGGIPFADGAFDVVACRWVLEHVARPAVFLHEVSRVLRPGGWLVAHSISAAHYVTWIRRALGLLPHSWIQRLVTRLYGRPAHDTFATFYRLNTPGQLRSWARPAGLRLTTWRRYANLGEYFSFCPPLRCLAVLTDWLLEQLAPGWGRIYFTAVLHKPLAAGGQAPGAETALACHPEQGQRAA